MADVPEPLYPSLPSVADITTPPPSTNLITPSTTKERELDPKSSISPITPATRKDATPIPISEELTKSPLPPIPLNATTVTPDPTPRVAPTLASKGVITSPVQAFASQPLLSAAEIATLSLTDLREQLTISQSEIAKLRRSYEESQAASRHWMLQHKMLEADYANEKDRFEMEVQLSKREVDVLRGYDSRRSIPGNTSMASIGGGTAGAGGEEDIYSTNEKLRERLSRAKNLIQEERAAKKDLEDMVERLKKRIRDNRRHDNMVDRAILHVEASRGLKRSESNMTTTSQDGLAALGEVASQVLMEQEARAGTTPRRTAGHTPRASLVSPIELQSVTATPSKKRRRRKSRDSTISMSDGEAPTVVNTPVRKVQRQESHGQLAGAGSPGTPKRARAGAGGASSSATPRSVKKKTSAGRIGASPLATVDRRDVGVREGFGAALRYAEGDGT